jgi:hypothetical protein
VRVPSPEGAVLLSSDIPKQTWLPSISRPRSRQYLRLNIAAAGGGPGSKFRACAMVGYIFVRFSPSRASVGAAELIFSGAMKPLFTPVP